MALIFIHNAPAESNRGRNDIGRRAAEARDFTHDAPIQSIPQSSQISHSRGGKSTSSLEKDTSAQKGTLDAHRGNHRWPTVRCRLIITPGHAGDPLFVDEQNRADRNSVVLPFRQKPERFHQGRLLPRRQRRVRVLGNHGLLAACAAFISGSVWGD